MSVLVSKYATPETDTEASRVITADMLLGCFFILFFFRAPAVAYHPPPIDHPDHPVEPGLCTLTNKRRRRLEEIPFQCISVCHSTNNQTQIKMRPGEREKGE
jgi:hypothetical protein